MSKIRKQIEKGFETFAHVIYRNRIKTLLLLFIFVAAIISQIPKITFDLSTEGLLHHDDPAHLEYNAFRDQFGRDEVIIVAIKPPEVFDNKFLSKLKKLHNELEEDVPNIDDITSLINARSTRGEGDELIVGELLEDWPQTDTELETLKKRTLSNPLYKNLLISEDGKFTTIIIKSNTYSSGSPADQNEEDFEAFEEESEKKSNRKNVSDTHQYLTDKENSDIVLAVKTITQKYRADDFEIYLAGSPIVTHFLKQSMRKDFRKFLIIMIFVVSIFLYILFRRITGVIFPLIIVLLSLFSTLGLMAATGIPFKLPTQILPSFLLAVGIGAAVHILSIFYLRLQKNDSQEDAIAYSMGHSGLAIVMTSVTTACGLASFSTAEIAPIADLGIFASTGVLLSLIYTVVALPAMLGLFPIKIKQKQQTENRLPSKMDGLLKKVGDISTGYPKTIIVTTAVIILISIIGITRLHFSHYPLEWFPADNEIRIAIQKIDKELKGTINLEIVIDTQKENGLYEPDFLNRLEKAIKFVESLEFKEVYTGKAWTLTTMLKETHQALNENQPEFYTIPQTKELIAQELLLFENSGSDDLEDVVDSQFSMVRFSIKVPEADAVLYSKYIDTVEDYFKTEFPKSKITFTGMLPLLFRAVSRVIISMAKSYMFAFVVITILMIFLIGKVRIGFISMVPNFTPILITLGIMGFLQMRLDLLTMLVGSIAIGLAVDDTIHFMHNFRRYFEEDGDPISAIHKTLYTVGRAMLVTSIVLSLGFFMYIFATMNSFKIFGILTAFTIIMALLADYFITPALMVLLNPKKNPATLEGK